MCCYGYCRIVESMKSKLILTTHCGQSIKTFSSQEVTSRFLLRYFSLFFDNSLWTLSDTIKRYFSLSRSLVIVIYIIVVAIVIDPRVSLRESKNNFFRPDGRVKNGPPSRMYYIGRKTL